MATSSGVMTQEVRTGAGLRAEQNLKEAVQVLGLTAALEVITESTAIPELKGAMRRCLADVREEQRRLSQGSAAGIDPEEPRIEGTVKVFKEDNGYGFIGVPGSRDVFVHRKAVRGGPTNLHEGQRVRFSMMPGPKGPQAQDVEIL